MPITNSREIRNLRRRLALSERQKQILIGSLLGDGCLIPNSWNKHYRFQVEQKAGQKNYVLWLYQEFRDWVLTEPAYHPVPRSWKFRTVSHPELTDLAHEFYADRTKVLPVRISELLNSPLSLAIWAMDDGCLMPRRDGFTFNTQSFTAAENEQLRACLQNRFGLLHTSLHHDKNRMRLYIKKASLSRLQMLLEQYILPEFTYKLPIAP